MPRAKNYIRSEALEKARDAFWEHGFDALGVRAIEDLTGLNRFAIQTDFGGKEGLFLEALDLYAEESLQSIIAPLQAGSLSAIEQFFMDLTTCKENDRRIFGCLMVNTVVENAGLNHEEFKARTDAHYERLLDGFRSALNNARAKGEVPEDFDVEEAASFLLGVGMGIQVFIRMKGDVSAGKQQADMVLKILGSWRHETG